MIGWLSGPIVRRVFAVVALLGMLLVVGATVASIANAQVPELPVPLPTESEPEPEPDPTPQPEPTPGDDVDEPTQEPTVAPPEQFFPPAPPAPEASPADLREPAVPGPTSAPRATARPAAAARTTGINPVAGALPGAFGITLAGLLGVAGLGGGMLALAKRGLLAVRADDGGIDVEATKRWRLLGGLGLLGAAAAVGVIGWLKISLETLVAVQMVYVASTGFAVLVLAVAGGSLLIAEQLRADERRLREVEDALVSLATQVQPLVSEPPRVIPRGKAGKRFDPDVTGEIR